ncbi:glycosyl hydrolases family 11 domain-containing protein [Sarocladium implicatum]|nr:glycosyl hydrolases family 11 domain-containing protein [Sarocladium implicatum]
MILSKALAFILPLATGAIAAPHEQPKEDLERRQSQPHWYKYWANDQAVVEAENRDGGEFALSWAEPTGGNFVIGKGYQTGFETKFKYSGTFTPGANSNTYLALYGWTYGPTQEYYVMESFGVHHPADNANSTCYGHFESDGGTYEIWDKYNGQLHQLWSVRTTRRVGGTITTGNHFRAFEAAGLKLGRQGEMIIGIEGQWGSGHATITAGVAPTTSVKESATPTTRTQVSTRKGTCTASIDIS